MKDKKPTSRANSGQLFDELLVTMTQAGDRDAARRLVARWHPRLARTARRLLQDDEAALVATQEAWISILRSLAKLRDPSRFAPWAFGILRRRCADVIRKNTRSREMLAPEDTSLATGPATSPAPAAAASPAMQDETLAIAQAFASLPPDQRLAAQLYFVEGLTLAEIAEALDVPIGTAKSRLFHARRKLKAALSGDDQ